jgi:hypothetical protein
LSACRFCPAETGATPGKSIISALARFLLLWTSIDLEQTPER